MTIEPLTISDAAAAFRGGTLTPSALLEQCLERMDAYEPHVRAWAFVDRDRARNDARRLTEELAAGQDRGPLHGIPIGVKDIIDVVDMPTGCGSKRWAGSIARQDAAVVARLRQAGAVIVGKTITTPFAFTDPPFTRNPWNLGRSPGGSSSGSAAAVATGSCLAALGTQTGGSLIRPASYCGVYCLKPTHGRISVEGCLALAPSLDHVGAMANSVLDLAVVFAALADVYLDAEVQESNRDLIGLTGFFPERREPAMREAFEQFHARCASRGWQWSESALPTNGDEILRHQLVIMSVESAFVHADRLARYPDDYPPRIQELILKGCRCTPAEYESAIAHRRQFAEDMDKLLARMSGVIVVPAASGAAPTPETTGDFAYQAPWSYAGLPVVSLPIARTNDGLPLAAALVGRRGQEVQLLARAEELAYDLSESLNLPQTLPPVPA